MTTVQILNVIILEIFPLSAPGSEPGDRVPQLDDEDLSLLTQNRENVTPQTADDEHDKELNADTRPPTMNERRGSDVSGGREEPMSPPENADQGEDHQHQTDCEESAGEDEAATSGRVVEEEGFSGDPGNPSRGEKSDDAGHSDDKDTQPPAATEQIGSEASEDWNIQMCHTQEQRLVTITSYINSHLKKVEVTGTFDLFTPTFYCLLWTQSDVGDMFSISCTYWYGILDIIKCIIL